MDRFSNRGLSSWNALAGTSAHNVSNNITSPDEALLNVPTYMLESFLPGFGLISRLLLSFTGIDISSVVSAFMLAAGMLTALQYSWLFLSSLTTDWLAARVTIKAGDKLYEQTMDWISKQQITNRTRHLLAQAAVSTSDAHDLRGRRGHGRFDYTGVEATIPPLYTPAHGKHTFWHRNRRFTFNRDEPRDGIGGALRSLASGGTSFGGETITITCLGFTPAPVKQLLMDIKAFSAQKNRSNTIVRRAGTGYEGGWRTQLVRPSRPLDTVYMDEAIKKDVLEDMREFLGTDTPRFYARRGIPYRRGYLFHGPPGTGKTSLSFALAGDFGMDLHVCGLRDPQMTEQRLTDLMSNLPSRCIVLIEDIDSAGIKRDDVAESPIPAETQVSHAGRTGRGRQAFPDADRQQGITLSGLLNAIDGVSSQEGRLLIMTTNHPEKLDPALIRPGRVDHQVYFGNASATHMRQIFLRMFTRDPPLEGEGAAATNDCKSASDADAAQLEDMATRFADALEEDVFTPAEIQGFLLVHRKSPSKALESVPAWSVELKAAKAAGRNVIASAAPAEQTTLNGAAANS